jgi:anti-anti-sigma factor
MSSSEPSYRPQWAVAPLGLACASYAQGPGFARVALSGELDISSAPQLREELVEAAGGSAVVILDLSELTFMDSSGLQAILTAHAHLAEAGCRLVLIRGGRQVQQIFEITGTESRLAFISAPVAGDLAAVWST